MASNAPDAPEAASQEPVPAAESSRWRWIPVGLWAALVLGFSLLLTFGGVTAISYDSNLFRTVRVEDYRSFLAIWQEQIEDLPQASAQWLLSGAFVAAIVLSALCFAYGAWLLLVAAHRSGEDSRVVARRSPRA